MRKLTLREVKLLEAVTVFLSLIGASASLVHGNLYEYAFDLFSIASIDLNFRMLYVSVLAYSCLAVAVFASLLLLNEKNPEIRYWNYIQGWLLIVMAASSYEWAFSLHTQAAQLVLTGQTMEQHYTLFAKGASVIFFGALFIFWILEKLKARKLSVQVLD